MKRPLLFPILSFLAGILLAHLSGISVSFKFVLSALFFIFFLLTATIKTRKVFFFLLCLSFLTLGFFRYTDSITVAENDISKCISKDPVEAIIYGTVEGYPERKDTSYGRHLAFTFRVERLFMDEREYLTTGLARVSLSNAEESPYIGDKLIIGGKISLPAGTRNPGGFNYKKYLNQKGVRATIYSSPSDYYLKTGTEKGPLFLVKRALSIIRDHAGEIIDKHLSQPAKAIVESVILGSRGGVTAEIRDMFTTTGTAHILAVSGLHIGIVAVLAMGILHVLRCPGNLKYFLTVISIFLFAALTGCRASSMRAAIMGAVVLFNLMLQRKSDIVSALAISAFLITFFRPNQLFDHGFILSYLAILSIIYVVPLTDSFFNVKIKTPNEGKITAMRKHLLKALSVSFAVWVGMMPVIASYFYIITPVAIILNLLAIPVLSVVVALGFGFLFTAPIGILTPLTGLISGLLDVVVTLFMGAMRIASQMPFSHVRVSSLGMVAIIIFYAVLVLVLAVFRRREKSRVLVIIFLLFAGNLFLWNEISKASPESLRVTFFDTGKSDASLLEFPDGGVMMIDAGTGGAGGSGNIGREVLAPYFWKNGIRQIDCILLTHGHEDHIGGVLYTLKNFNVKTVIDGIYDTQENSENLLYKKVQKIIKRKNIDHLKVKRGDIIQGFPGFNFIVFNPPQKLYGDANEDSIVIKVSANEGGSIVFYADIGSTAMRDIIRFGSLLNSDLIKIPHHGMGLGEMLVVADFFRRIECTDAIVTNSNNKRLNKRLLKTLHNQGVKVHTTGKSGAIVAEGGDCGFRITSQNTGK